MDECRQLIERGFGSYLLQKRLDRKKRRLQLEAQGRGKAGGAGPGERNELVEGYRAILAKYTLKVKHGLGPRLLFPWVAKKR